MATPVPANLLPADLRQPSAVPADLLPEELRPKAAVVPMDLLPADLRAPQEKPPEAGFSAADIGISGVRGVLGVTKAITDVFGADNAASKKLEGYSKAMADLYTPERQKEIAYYEKKQQEAEASGKPVEEIKAALESIKAAPLQATAEAVGSIVPNLASLFIPVVGEARGAALARSAYNMFIGILEGTGAVKGSIYDNVKAELVKNKVPEEEAAKIAEQAQSYTGKNFDQILVGAGIGGATGKFGVEQLLTPKAGKLAQKAAAVGSEMFTEAGQASQEQFAANLAARREGMDVDLLRGVAGAATKEGVMGALGAGTVGAVSRTAAPEAPPTEAPPVTVPRGSDIIQNRLTELQNQPQTPETQRLIQELTQQLQSVRAEEQKIDTFKQEIADMPQEQRQQALQTLQQEQQERQSILSDPQRMQEYAQSQNLEIGQAQQQLQDLFTENQIRERAYSELLETLPQGTGEISYVSDISELTPEQRTQFLDRAIEPLRNAVAENKITQDDAVRIVNKSLENEVLQQVGIDLLANRNGELVENMLEVLRREPAETIKESMDNADFMEEMERIARQSLEEQKELRADIAAIEEGDVKAAEKYELDLENQDDIDATIAMLELELNSLRNLSQDESTYNRLRDEVTEARTKEQREDKQKDKQQEEFTDVPDDILEKLDAHAFGQKLGAEYRKVGAIDYFVQPRENKEMAKAVKSDDRNGVADQLAKSKNPAIRMVAEKMRGLNTTMRLGFPKQWSHKKWAGYFDPNFDVVALRKKYSGSEEVVAHEFVHALTVYAINNPTAQQKPTVDKLQKLFEHVRKELGVTGREVYGLTNLKEFVAEANSNVNFQYQLAKIKYKNETAWGAFTRAIANLLGIANVSALTEVMALTEELTSKQMTTGQQPGVVAPSKERVLPSKPSAAPQRTTAGQQAMDTMSNIGRQVAPPPPNFRQKVQSVYNSATQNPQLTAQTAKTATKRFMDKMETVVFSSDAALNNEIRRNIMASMAGSEQKIGMLLETSLSQTMHADAMASLHMMEGKIEYNKELHKWEAKKSDANLVKLAEQVDQISKKYGLTKEEAMLVAHTAFEAKRLRSMDAAKKAIDAEVNKLRAEARSLTAQAKADEDAGDMDGAENKRFRAEKVRATARKEAAKKKVVHMTPVQINSGLDLFKTMPELKGLVDTWQQMRKNTADVLVESGLWSQEEAELLLENIDYVPFYREEQIEQGKGPKEYIRGLQVQARDPRFKGSMRPVNDIFDNMARWMQYAVNRSVRNRSALALIDAATDNNLGKKVTKPARGGNNVNVWRNGKQEFYVMDDPLYVDAFRGLESVAIPALNFFSRMSNLLRQSVVMYPLFSVAQIPQDSFAAMFSSGLKPQFALRIPVLAVKEFLKTVSKRSQTHDALRKVGAVGVKDFSSAVARMDAEMLAGLKAPPGVVGKVKNFLTHFAMSADNAVRQAVYEATLQSGKSQAEAMEKAFQVINFRNRGSSKILALAGQVIPFFNAYLAAQHVAYKTVTGVGISPSDRTAALQTLAATTASVMTLALIYAMMNADDEDYLNKPAAVRDRLLMIPGTGGVSIPLRMDLFTVPKVITEHTYLLLTDKGYEDSRKFKDSMKNALVNALASPTVVPQAVKPLVEVGINYNFFQGRPLVGTFQKGLETERQFNDSTSELAKVIGSSGLVSPIAADHLIRGMFGSVGGLALYMTNPLLHNDPTVERPSLSMRDAMAALPGTSGFISREYETALKTDFYVLRDEVAKVVNTVNDMKTRSPQDIDSYLEKPGVEEKYSLQKTTNRITQELTKIRKNIGIITNATDMTAAEKQEQIKDLRETERELLKSVDVKELREMAKI